MMFLLKTRIGLRAVLLLITTLFFTQCQTIDSAKVAWKDEPFKDVKLSNDQYSINTKSDTTITTDYGTTIAIPAGCFVDENGNPINDVVDIEFNEIHHPGQVLASGINMDHSEGEEEGNLVTAGMFQINGSYKGKPIEFAEGKSMQFNMPSRLDDDMGVNFYQMDTIEGKWNRMIKKHSITRIENKIIREIPEPTPVKQPLEGNVIELEFEDPALRAFKGSFWQYGGDLASNDPFSKDWFNKGKYSVLNYDVVNTNSQIGVNITLASTTNGEQLTSYIIPVLTGEALNEAIAVYEQAKIRQAQMQRANYDIKVASFNGFKVTRQFQLSGFGTYNWDCFYANTNAVVKYCRLNEKGAPGANAKVYLVREFKGEKGIVRQKDMKAGSAELRFATADKNALILVFPNDEIGVISGQSLNDFAASQKDDLSIDKLVSIDDLTQLENVIAQL